MVDKFPGIVDPGLSHMYGKFLACDCASHRHALIPVACDRRRVYKQQQLIADHSHLYDMRRQISLGLLGTPCLEAVGSSEAHTTEAVGSGAYSERWFGFHSADNNSVRAQG